MKSFVFALAGIVLQVEAQFPSYFFSQQGNAAPPNCVCQKGQSGSVNINANNNFPNNNYPGNNYPINNYPGNNYPPNNVNNYPVNNYPPNNYPPNNYPINNYPVDRDNSGPINSFPNSNYDPISNGNNFPGNNFPNNNQPYPINAFSNGQRSALGAGALRSSVPNRRYLSNDGSSAMQICGTDGRVYTDVCLIINAQFQNPNLGGRPCNLQSAVQAVQQQGNNFNNNQIANQGPVCMNDGTTAQSANAALSLMLNSQGLGIKCQGQCPCPLSCPPTANSNQNSHHSDCFNHWSFHHGPRGNGRPSGPG